MTSSELKDAIIAFEDSDGQPKQLGPSFLCLLLPVCHSENTVLSKSYAQRMAVPIGFLLSLAFLQK